MNFDGTNPRITEIRLKLIEDLSKIPRDVPYDLGIRLDPNGWNKCRDDDVLSSIFRGWKNSANDMQRALVSDIASIIKIDTKGNDVSEEDKFKRSRFIDNIEGIVGKGKGEEFLILDPGTRWSKLLDYLESSSIFPRDKDGPRSNVYRTVSYDGHIELQLRSIDRAHNQVQNQNIRNIESFVEIPKLRESELLLLYSQNAKHVEACEQSIVFHRVQQNVILKRISAMKENSEFRRLMSSSDATTPDVDINDIIDMDRYELWKKNKKTK